MKKTVRAAGVLALAFAPIAARGAHAQTPITSTGQLKQACKSSPGNRVVFNTSTGIKEGVLRGVTLPNYENVSTGCTIVLGQSSKFKFDGVAMNFAGPLGIESATGNELEFDKANIYAQSVTIALPGDASALFIKEVNINSLAGDTTVNFGNNGKLEANGSSASCTRVLEASNSVRLSAGDKFSASFSQGYIWGVNGVDINLTGAETVYKVNEFNTHSQPGTVSMRASGAKSTFELGRGSFYGYAGLSLEMTGAEAQLITSNFTAFNTYVGAGVRISVGANQPKGTIKMDQPLFGGAGGLVIQAGMGGLESMIEFIKGSVIGMADAGVTIETGAGSNTTVKDSSIRPGGGAAPIRIRAGAGGFCLAENNTLAGAPPLRDSNSARRA